MLAPERALATEFVLFSGLNLSSPRTALDSSLTNYTTLTGGFGFDIHVKDHAYLETDLNYVTRRFSSNFSMPTIIFPLLGRFENKYLIVGVGPYMGMILGVSSDNGETITLASIGQMSAFDFGGVFELGFKLPLTKTINVFFDGRILRALTASYTEGTDSFYWAEMQGSVGVQIKTGR